MNKKFIMKKYIFAFLALAVLTFSCDEEDIHSEAVISFEGLTTSSDQSSEIIPIAVPYDESNFEFVINVWTNNTSSSDRQFQLFNDTDLTTLGATYYSLPETVNIPAGSNKGEILLTVDVSQIDLTSASADIAVRLLSDGDTYTVDNQDPDNNVYLRVSEICTLNEVFLNITTDDWPDETSWELYDTSTSPITLLASGGPFVNPDDDFSVVQAGKFCLDSGNYGVIVYDSYGDGISGGGFAVVLNGTTIATGIVGPSASPGSQSSFGSATFTLD